MEHLESVDVLAAKNFSNAKDIQGNIATLKENFSRILGDRTMTAEAKLLAKAELFEKANQSIERMLEALKEEVQGAAVEWHKQRFSSQAGVNPAEAVLLPIHLERHKQGKTDLSNPGQAAALATMAKQNLLPSDMLDAVDAAQSPEALRAFKEVEKMLPMADTALAQYREFKEHHAPSQKIKTLRENQWRGPSITTF